MKEMKEVRYYSDDRIWVDDQLYIGIGTFNRRLLSLTGDIAVLHEKIKEMYKENKALRAKLGLPEEGPIEDAITKVEVFFDDSGEEAKDEEICRWDLKSDGTSRTTCGKWVGEIMSSHNFDHCPYCGKKVKRLYMADELLNYESKEE